MRDITHLVLFKKTSAVTARIFFTGCFLVAGTEAGIMELSFCSFFARSSRTEQANTVGISSSEEEVFFSWWSAFISSYLNESLDRMLLCKAMNDWAFGFPSALFIFWAKFSRIGFCRTIAAPVVISQLIQDITLVSKHTQMKQLPCYAESDSAASPQLPRES